jgi:hypothetical protein
MERTIIIGWVLSTLAAAFLLLSGIMYVLKAAPVRKRFEEIGYPLDLLRTLGVSKVLIATLCLIPATSFLGLILATSWLGGAIAAHVRVKDKFIAPALFLILLWAGFGLRHQDAMHRLFGF